MHPPVPLLDAAIWIPALGEVNDPAAAIPVVFLVDSGADMTVLHPQDSRRLFVNEEQWAKVRQYPSISVGGAGQDQPHYQVPGYVLLLHEDQQVDMQSVELHIAERHAGNEQIESLLGRDVLQHYVTTFDQVRALSLITPAS